MWKSIHALGDSAASAGKLMTNVMIHNASCNLVKLPPLSYKGQECRVTTAAEACFRPFLTSPDLLTPLEFELSSDSSLAENGAKKKRAEMPQVKKFLDESWLVVILGEECNDKCGEK